MEKSQPSSFEFHQIPPNQLTTITPSEVGCVLTWIVLISWSKSVQVKQTTYPSSWTFQELSNEPSSHHQILKEMLVGNGYLKIWLKGHYSTSSSRVLTFCKGSSSVTYNHGKRIWSLKVNCFDHWTTMNKIVYLAQIFKSHPTSYHLLWHILIDKS